MRRVGPLVIAASLLGGCADTSTPRSEPRADVPSFSANTSDNRASTPANVQVAPAPVVEKPAPSSGGMDDVVAYVRGQPMTMRTLVEPLIEAHGLTVLLNLIQLELAKQDAANSNIVVTSKDFDDEHEATLNRLLQNSEESKLQQALDKAIEKHDEARITQLRADIHSDREDFLTQYLANQHVDRTEFDLVLKINTYLRKLAEPQIGPKITEQALHIAFGQMFGERIAVRYMQLANMDEVNEAKRRLHDGDSFERVARDLSHDQRSASLGGELTPFSREIKSVPENFKAVAFSLKDGEVSDVVAMGTSFDIIKRIRMIPPVAVKFETERNVVYKKLYDSLLEQAVKQLRKQLADQARLHMRIVDPILSRQFDEKIAAQQRAGKKAREELDREQHRQDLLKPPALFKPGTAPTTGAAPPATKAGAGERPPAPRPGPTTRSSAK